jgi:hypothetical protein
MSYATVTADPETLMRQAGTAAGIYLCDAIKFIDREFGEGYAAKHPDLVGKFMETCARDYAATSFDVALGSAASGMAETVAQALGEVAAALQKVAP